MSKSKTIATLTALAFGTLALAGAAGAAEKPATAPGQEKAAGQPANPAGKQAAPGQTGANPGQMVAADCAKLADPKAKDDCVKKVQAATGKVPDGKAPATQPN